MKRKGFPMHTVVMLAIIGTVSAVLLCAALLFFQTYCQAMYQTAATSGRRTISQVSSTLEEYLGDINNVMTALEESLEDSEIEREEFFSAFLRIRPDVVCASTYDTHGNLYACYNLGHTVRTELDTNLSFNSDLLAQYQNGYISAPHVVTLFEGFYPWVVTIIAPLDEESPEEWIALDISCTNISSYINGIGIGQRGYCFLIDADGNIIYHPQQQLLYSELKQENTDLITTLPDGSHRYDSVIYTVQSLQNGPWRVVGVTYVDEVIANSVIDMIHIMIPAAVMLLIAMLLISVVLSHLLSHPLGALANAMQEFEGNADHFSYKSVGGVQEVRTLSESFSHMVLQIKQLMENARNEEINLRKTELRALQAQINPHFLYNTLDAISWMCEQGKNTEAVRMVNALATLFRISISRGHELIPIRSELQHAESYLKIQAFRYKNQFTYSFDVDDDCLDYLCNKITLQPIIENAIYHGINGLVDEGHILITVQAKGEDIVFTVEDNGMGMEEEQIESIMSRERSDHTGIGIKNVNDRLKIYFGNSYGIHIDSVLDEGTKVSICMPKVFKEADYENR